MLQIRKFPLGDKKTLRELLHSLFEQMLFACESRKIDVIYDSYLESSVKECQRVSIAQYITRVEDAVLTVDTNISSETGRFWTTNKNRYYLEIKLLIWLQKHGVKIILSGYVDNGNGAYSCGKAPDGNTEPCKGLKSYTDETDERIINDIAKAAKDGYQRALILANVTHVLVLLLHYMDGFEKCGIKKVWVKCRMRISQRFIPVHSLYHKLEKSVINSQVKLHVLTSSDVTTKVGTKSATINASQEMNLWKFCSFESEEYVFRKVELYLVKVLRGKSTSSTLDELWYITVLLLNFQLIIFLRYSK